jgi:hypothetical protein
VKEDVSRRKTGYISHNHKGVKRDLENRWVVDLVGGNKRTLGTSGASGELGRQ